MNKNRFGQQVANLCNGVSSPSQITNHRLIMHGIDFIPYLADENFEQSILPDLLVPFEPAEFPKLAKTVKLYSSIISFISEYPFVMQKPYILCVRSNKKVSNSKIKM